MKNHASITPKLAEMVSKTRRVHLHSCAGVHVPGHGPPGAKDGDTQSKDFS
jgi:hypothetical protein